MKVLIVTPFFRPSIGGVETHIDDLIAYLSKHGHSVDIITYTPNVTGNYRNRNEVPSRVPLRETKKNSDIRRIRWFGNGLFYALSDYMVLEFLYLVPALLVYGFAFLLTRKVDVINAHGFMAAFVVRVLSKLFKVRTVMTVHAVYDLEKHPLLRVLSRWMMSSFNTILVLSNRSLKDFNNLRLPKNKMAVYTHWVDQNIFKPPTDREVSRKKYGFQDCFVILFVGKLYWTKGIHLLFEVAKKLPSDARILLIGSGPMEPQIRSMSKMRRNIEFLGKVSIQQLVEYYGLADIFILPSVPGYSHQEGFARVVIEALSCGTPAIVSNTGCLPDIVDQTVGRVVIPTPDGVRKEIMRLYDNKDELARLRKSCRMYAEKNFSERNAEKIERALRA